MIFICTNTKTTFLQPTPTLNKNALMEQFGSHISLPKSKHVNTKLTIMLSLAQKERDWMPPYSHPSREETLSITSHVYRRH